jgi:ELWxxDGT repeat protein
MLTRLYHVTLAALFLLGGAAAAAQPQLVGDLNTTTASPPPREASPIDGRIPVQFWGLGERALFVVARPWGQELWSSGGGTEAARSFFTFAGCPSCGPTFFANLDGIAFFTVLAPAAGEYTVQVWRTDGTFAGTFPLPIFANSSFRTSAVPHFRLGARLYFSACDATAACTLLGTDGSVGGTRTLAALTIHSSPVATRNRAYFFAYDASGHGLWTTDGTQSGTRLLRSFNNHWVHELALTPGRAGRLFFMAGGNGDELWTSDGSAAGTTRLARLAGCSERFGCASFFLASGDPLLYLVSSGRLWRSDGTKIGTFALGEIIRPVRALVAGQRLVVATEDNSLWTSDGSRRGTRRLVGCPQGCPQTAFGAPLVAFGERVLFFARGAAGQVEIWQTDGTGPGTRLTSRARGPAVPPTAIRALAARTQVYFALDYQDPEPRSELWGTDGTPAGTLRLARLAYPAPPSGGSLTADLALAGTDAYFSGYDAELGVQPWRSDGSLLGTRRIAIVETLVQGRGSDPRGFAALGSRTLFTACSGDGSSLWSSGDDARDNLEILALAPHCQTGGPKLLVAEPFAYFTLPDPGPEPGLRQLWRTDGTAGGTLPLTALADAVPGEPFLVGGEVHTVVQRIRGFGAQLWRTDGSPGGTIAVGDFPTAISDLQAITPLGAEFYFVAQSAAVGLRFFRSDSDPANAHEILASGPELLAPNYDGYPFYPPRFTRANRRVFFAHCSPYPGPCGLWASDGTPGGARLVKSDQQVVFGFRTPLVEWRDRLYFAGDDGLWSSDGTAEGTQQVCSVSLDFYNGSALLATRNRLYFLAIDAAGNRELWTSDGTGSGTQRVADSLEPRDLTAVADRLYFSAVDAEHGRELWSTDGTGPGTGPVADLAPGTLSSYPTELTALAGGLFFSANDGVVGREPWRLPSP